MAERKIDNRGSKSVIFYKNNFTENEQRMYDSLCVNYIHKRYILMGFERNYRVKILFSQINKVRSYSSITLVNLRYLYRMPCLLVIKIILGLKLDLLILHKKL